MNFLPSIPERNPYGPVTASTPASAAFRKICASVALGDLEWFRYLVWKTHERQLLVLFDYELRLRFTNQTGDEAMDLYTLVPHWFIRKPKQVLMSITPNAKFLHADIIPYNVNIVDSFEHDLVLFFTLHNKFETAISLSAVMDFMSAVCVNAIFAPDDYEEPPRPIGSRLFLDPDQLAAHYRNMEKVDRSFRMHVDRLLSRPTLFQREQAAKRAKQESKLASKQKSSSPSTHDIQTNTSILDVPILDTPILDLITDAPILDAPILDAPIADVI